MLRMFAGWESCNLDEEFGLESYNLDEECGWERAVILMRNVVERELRFRWGVFGEESVYWFREQEHRWG